MAAIESQMKSDGHINSAYRYRSARRAFERAWPLECRDDEINVEILNSCEDRLRMEGLSYTTINIYMRTLKATLHALQGHTSPLFGGRGYHIPCAARRMMALNREDIGAIAQFKGTPAQNKYRDLWLFSYLCNGINFRDMLFLRYSNICNDEIVFIRSKTRNKWEHPRTVRAVINPLMLKIMERSGNGASNRPDAFIFPYAHEGMTPAEEIGMVRRITSLCNKVAIIISQKSGIPHFSTYSARHSFATCLQRHGADLLYISESLGHSSLEMTRNYIDGYDKKYREKLSRKLLE